MLRCWANPVGESVGLLFLLIYEDTQALQIDRRNDKLPRRERTVLTVAPNNDKLW